MFGAAQRGAPRVICGHIDRFGAGNPNDANDTVYFRLQPQARENACAKQI